MRQLALIAAAVAALVLAVGSATAAGPTVDEFPVSFVLTSATCSNLPPGTTVVGTGTEKSITSTKEKGGVTTISNQTHAHGTASDQDGNTYVFDYSNHFSVSNTGPTDPVFSGTMVDSFSLAGGGPARLSNGFRAIFTTDFASLFSFTELSSRGDPIDFATGAARCDPL